MDLSEKKQRVQHREVGSTTAIEVTNLQFAYSKKSKPILDIKKWQIPKGEHIFLSGPSGSGKSTLLNLLCGTLTPSKGKISLLEQPFSSLSNRQRDTFRARNIGVVFQQFNLIPYLSVAQNINAAVYFANKGNVKNSKEVTTATRQMLNRLQLSDSLLHAKADTLSIGQQQRVAIARALINDPQLLIIDEPTSALDTDARDSFMSLLKDVAADSTMIFVSHDEAMKSYFEHHCSISQLNGSLGNSASSSSKDTTNSMQERD